VSVLPAVLLPPLLPLLLLLCEAPMPGSGARATVCRDCPVLVV